MNTMRVLPLLAAGLLGTVAAGPVATAQSRQVADGSPAARPATAACPFAAADGADPLARARAQQVRSLVTDVVAQARRNTAFRRVVHTGALAQLVVMSIPPGGQVGEETHPNVEQTFVVAAGRGRAVLGRDERAIGPGDAVIIPMGVTHNIVNAGRSPLQLYTVYSPPSHLEGRVQATRDDAAADREDASFGRRCDARSPHR